MSGDTAGPLGHLTIPCATCGGRGSKTYPVTPEQEHILDEFRAEGERRRAIKRHRSIAALEELSKSDERIREIWAHAHELGVARELAGSALGLGHAQLRNIIRGRAK